MLKTVFLSFMLLAAGSLAAENVKLPPPVKRGGKPLMDVLSARKTIRDYTEKKLSLQQLSNLLWAANGINRLDGKRTAPSAINAREIELFLLLPEGSYKYDPKENMLVEVNRKDCRKLAGDRFTPPAAVLIVANQEKQERRMRTQERRDHYSKIDAGYVSQNIYLFCASEGFGTVAVGSIAEPGTIRKELNLTEKQLPLLGHPVGFPE